MALSEKYRDIFLFFKYKFRSINFDQCDLFPIKHAISLISHMDQEIQERFFSFFRDKLIVEAYLDTLTTSIVTELDRPRNEVRNLTMHSNVDFKDTKELENFVQMHSQCSRRYCLLNSDI